MSHSSKSLTEVRRQLGMGTILMFVGVIWFCVILFGMRPDQIWPSNENVHTALDALKAQLSIPVAQWDFDAVGLIITKAVVLFVIDVLFVVTRYGGLTLVFLGGFMIFDAISKAPRASR